jgi:hypothetical protein
MTLPSSTSRFPANGLLTIRIQSILYNTPLPNIMRALEYFDNAARVACESGIARQVTVAYGDCSPNAAFDREELEALLRQVAHLESIHYTRFGENLGHGGGQNRLFESATSDLLLIANPDVLAAPTLFIELVDALARANIGLVEARQLPIEHPKHYDPATGETSWASMACALMPAALFRELGGFDAETFFMYGDDVDFSWRVRLAGFKVIHQASAAVFHDKRLTNEGGSVASAVERYYSAEAGLLLPYKYSRRDLTDNYLEAFANSGDEYQLKAAKAVQLRLRAGPLPTPIDPDHTVAEFIDGGYGPTRFAPH